jgi:hypothetical protein
MLHRTFFDTEGGEAAFRCISKQHQWPWSKADTPAFTGFA